MMTKFQPDQIHYEREYILGEGLNSTVWRARRVTACGEYQSHVALKFLKQQSEVSFLRREFDTLQRVNSPFCNRVIAWETFEGEPALVLEWIDGVTLAEFAQIPSGDEIHDEIVRQIHLGLTHLRDSDLYHGDLHPGNVMIDREGRIRLIDFASGRTATGLIQATPAFLAPEVWLDGKHSFEADLFALGMIRKHLPKRFADLPARAKSSDRDELLRDDPRRRDFIDSRRWGTPIDREAVSRSLQMQIAFIVNTLLLAKTTSGTQLLAPEPPKVASPQTPLPSAIRMTNPKFRQTALALAVFLIVAIPVFAEGPATRAEKSAQILVTSPKWMHVSINGQDAGFTPVKVDKLEAGTYRVDWETSREKGSATLQLKPREIGRLNPQTR